MLTMIDFYADWCKPCQMMNDVIHEVFAEKAVQDANVNFEKVNIEEDVQQSQEYKVMSIPTFVFLKDGKEVDRIVGYTPKDKLLKTITGYL